MRWNKSWLIPVEPNEPLACLNCPHGPLGDGDGSCTASQAACPWRRRHCPSTRRESCAGAATVLVSQLSRSHGWSQFMKCATLFMTIFCSWWQLFIVPGLQTCLVSFSKLRKKTTNQHRTNRIENNYTSRGGKALLAETLIGRNDVLPRV
jgi:hypothetical protein